MTEQNEQHFEMIDRNKDRLLQQKRMATIIQVAGLLGVDELEYIKGEIGDMIADIHRKKMSRKIRIKNAIFGKKVFNSKVELQYYRKYKQINLTKELVMETHEAVGIAEGYIPAETVEEELKAWQHLIDTGMCWQLQGWFEDKLCS